MKEQIIVLQNKVEIFLSTTLTITYAQDSLLTIWRLYYACNLMQLLEVLDWKLMHESNPPAAKVSFPNISY